MTRILQGLKGKLEGNTEEIIEFWYLFYYVFWNFQDEKRIKKFKINTDWVIFNKPIKPQVSILQLEAHGKCDCSWHMRSQTHPQG